MNKMYKNNNESFEVEAPGWPLFFNIILKSFNNPLGRHVFFL